MKNTRFTLVVIQIILSSFFNQLHSNNIKKTSLKTRDIFSKNILFDNSFRKQVFNRIAGFNGKTYTKKVTFYIHNFFFQFFPWHKYKYLVHSFTISPLPNMSISILPSVSTLAMPFAI